MQRPEAYPDIPVISVLRRLKQEDCCGLEASLDYIAKSCLN